MNDEMSGDVVTEGNVTDSECGVKRVSGGFSGGRCFRRYVIRNGTRVRHIYSYFVSLVLACGGESQGVRRVRAKEETDCPGAHHDRTT